MSVAKKDVVKAKGSLQLCAGQKFGARLQYTLCILYLNQMTLIRTADRASNAFNALNRAALLHNLLVLCPIIISIYAINTYRQPFFIGGKEVESTEGATQGDPLAMGLYALSIQLLITSLKAASSVKQCWFGHDANGAGSITEIRTG